MKKKNYNNHFYRAFVDPKLMNTIIIVAAILLFLGPIMFLGSLIMKIIAFMLLINIIPSLFSGNTKNLGPKLIFSVILMLIVFRRGYFIPVAIVLGLIFLKNYQRIPRMKEGSYKYTSSDNDFSKKKYTNNDYTQSGHRKKTNAYTEPNDPFSYRKRESEIIDVEYEDWEPETKNQTYTKPNIKSKQSMDYSYSGNMSKKERGESEESEADCCDNNRDYEAEKEHNRQKVYIGSISKTIHQDSLNAGDNELSFICKLGDLNLIIDSRVKTDINCSIKAGEVRIGDECYNGVNQKIKRSWSPTTPSNKRLKLNCEVGLGEIRIKHKKLY